ncbi:hypothetical protein OJ996_03530 [Luteolibacter sp. GHJ8]|uniref:Uncharacterized protein n=1 Tax=Luteolibacter rhizosphaerae TaxID=2989719 RepID=A0ABT3FZE1_9BACT|nr:hypothetical protein [Luteolibacter rhizosphaerae]MCW1912631.1 hypothetical protein [Luteolibacter rhizosphaerae]
MTRGIVRRYNRNRCATTGTPSAGERDMKIRFSAFFAVAILAATQLSCTSMIENGHDHSHDPKFKKERRSFGSN